MFCPNCGHEMKDDEKYCSNCGAHVENGKAVNRNNVYTSYNAGRAMNEKEKEYGLVAMICGIASLVIPYVNIILAVVALIFAGRCQVDSNNFAKIGKITAIIGLILSIITILVTILWIVLLAVGLIKGPSYGGGTIYYAYHF